MTDDTFRYTGTSTLETLKDAATYNRFLENLLADFLNGSNYPALDFGAGIGEFAGRLKYRGHEIHCLEPDPAQRARLAERHPAFARLEDITASYDRIYSLNVLEHIEDDIAILRDLHARLTPGGQLLLYVPAFQILYSPFDRAVGHFRRYHRKELVGKLKSAGFTMRRAEYVDSLGFFAWLLLKPFSSPDSGLNPGAVKLYDRAVFPLSRLCDRLFKHCFGKNLLVVAQK